ncbi:MAG: HEPN domain-containing protein [Actinomycetota bacterium]
MNERPETLDERVARWIRWAREDLVLAECAHADKDAVPRGACAWAQQCAEKTLKAVIVAQGIDPPKTHNLLTLEQLMPDSVKTALVDLDLEELTRWSIQGRYPGDLEEATTADAIQAIADAAAVLRVVEAALQPPAEALESDV